jgi:hypothetical protein
MRCGLDFSLYAFRNVSQIVWFDNSHYGVQELRFRAEGRRIYGAYSCGILFLPEETRVDKFSGATLHRSTAEFVLDH